jgi:hypothetical protein
MNDDNLLGGVLGQLGQTVKQVAKQVAKVPEEMAKTAGGQVGSAEQNDSAEQNVDKVSDNKSKWQSDEERVRFLRGLYGPSKSDTNPTDGKKPTEFEEQILEKSPEDQKKLVELRGQLHQQNYYDPTFNPVKKQEERPAEKVENEKKQEMQDLQKKEEKKPPPLAVVHEQNKAEQFRGVSG